ncbi:MAG: DNA repair protein RecO [Treponema sp.]|jgi:DNA repair protein RecO (recombination protein O)|nr:DNA repair protein RecO [Treponema sp.]
MFRTQSYLALILRSRPFGESNRELWLLTAEAGLLRAMVFGGPRSRLRSHAAPFHSGQVWIYHDPVKDSRKLSDFDVCSWRPGIREQYERTVTADAVAETILASHGGGGNWGEALTLAEGVLDILETAGGELCERIFVYFLWRWAALLGLQPELERCVSCGKVEAQDSPFWYSPKEGGMLCAACVRENGTDDNMTANTGLFQAGPGCRRWLAAVNPLSPSLVFRYTMDNKSFREAKELAAVILADLMGKRPGSWDML